MTDTAASERVGGAAWWAVTVLLVAYTLSFIDRTILSLLVEPMRRDLGLSDTQISLLQGLAFSVFYTFAGIPIAAVTDRTSRRTVISVGVAVWSAMTAICGLAGAYRQLFLARVGVGVGEAALGPAAYSLIGDLFPANTRGRAMAIYGSGTNIGAGLALLIGGALIGLVGTAAPVETIIGPLRSWQLVFLVVGLPGIPVALAMLTIPEPRRDRSAARLAEPLAPFLKEHAGTIACHFLGLSACALIATAHISWGPTFFIRVQHFSPAEIGAVLGIIVLIAGPLGALAGGAVSDRWTRRGLTDGTLRAARIGLTGMAISGALMPFAPREGALALFALCTLFGAFAYPAGAAALVRLAPPRLRARMSALYLFTVTLIGGTIGPTAVALATDYLFADPLKVGWSLALAIGVAGALGFVAMTIGLPLYRASIGRRGDEA